jgi:hypothetical protein
MPGTTSHVGRYAITILPFFDWERSILTQKALHHMAKLGYKPLNRFNPTRLKSHAQQTFSDRQVPVFPFPDSPDDPTVKSAVNAILVSESDTKKFFADLAVLPRQSSLRSAPSRPEDKLDFDLDNEERVREFERLMEESTSITVEDPNMVVRVFHLLLERAPDLLTEFLNLDFIAVLSYFSQRLVSGTKSHSLLLVIIAKVFGIAVWDGQLQRLLVDILEAEFPDPPVYDSNSSVIARLSLLRALLYRDDIPSEVFLLDSVGKYVQLQLDKGLARLLPCAGAMFSFFTALWMRGIPGMMTGRFEFLDFMFIFSDPHYVKHARSLAPLVSEVIQVHPEFIRFVPLRDLFSIIQSEDVDSEVRLPVASLLRVLAGLNGLKWIVDQLMKVDQGLPFQLGCDIYEIKAAVQSILIAGFLRDDDEDQRVWLSDNTMCSMIFSVGSDSHLNRAALGQLRRIDNALRSASEDWNKFGEESFLVIMSFIEEMTESDDPDTADLANELLQEIDTELNY